jgi:hypothetical protein
MKTKKIKFEEFKEFLKEQERIEEFNNSSILEGEDDLPIIENTYFCIK